jgi:hypothetical protein
MKYLDHFYQLPTKLKDEFSDEMYHLGIIHSINPMEYKHRLKTLVNSNRVNKKLKKLYKFLRSLDEKQRDTFFNAFTEKLTSEQSIFYQYKYPQMRGFNVEENQ